MRELIDDVYRYLRGEGAEERASQKELSYIVYDTLGSGKYSCLEGQTGLGKSIALLIPAALFSLKTGETVAISTATKALQDQLVNKDFKRVARHIARATAEKTPVLAVLKGRNNYIDTARYMRYIEYSMQIEPDDEGIRHITRWLRETETGDMGEIPEPGLPDDMPATAICVQHGTADADHDCFYQKALDRARNANIVVTNHHSILSRFKAYTADQESIPAFDDLGISRILFDEGHEIENIALNIFTKSVSLFEVRSALSAILSFATVHKLGKGSKGKKKEGQQGVEKAIAHITKVMEELKASRGDSQTKIVKQGMAPKSGRNGTDLYVENVLKDLLNLKKSIRESVAYAQTVQAAAARKQISAGIVAEQSDYLSSIIEGIDAIKNSAHAAGTRIIVRYSDVRSYPSVIQGNSKLQALLASKWRLFNALVFISATMADPSRSAQYQFDFFANGVGLRRSQWARPELHTARIFPSPFSFADVKCYLPDTTVPAPKHDMTKQDRQEYEANVIRMIEHACQNDHEGGILVLCTSYRDVTTYSQSIINSEIDLGERKIILHQPGLRVADLKARLIERGKGGILFGVGNFWTGVDMPGKELTTIIIPKIPFSVPDDPAFMIRKLNWENDKTHFISVALPLANILLRQGIGRLIRTKTDSGSIYIGDPRVLRYPQFLASLAHIKNQITFKTNQGEKNNERSAD